MIDSGTIKQGRGRLNTRAQSLVALN